MVSIKGWVLILSLGAFVYKHPIYNCTATENEFNAYKVITLIVSHIKLDRVNMSKSQFGGQIRKFKKNKSIWKIWKIARNSRIMCVFGVEDWR